MKKIIYPIVILACLCMAACGTGNPEAKTGEAKDTAASGNPLTEEYTVTTKTTTLKWLSTKISGKNHYGHVPVVDGTLGVLNGRVASGRFAINLAQLTVDDITDPADNADLVQHLKDTDFFSCMTYPTGQFVLTGVAYHTADSATVAGNLTLKGITNNIEFPARIQLADNTLTATAAFAINRTRWGLNYHAGKSWKDKMILDNIDLSLTLVAAKK